MPIETETQRSRKEPKPSQFGDSFLIFLTLLFLINFLFATILRSQPPEVAYSQFIQDVQAGKVERATIGPDRIE